MLARADRYVLVSLAALVLAAGCGQSHDADKAPATAAPAEATARPVRTVRVTGIPDENPTELQRSYAPLVTMLERELGARVEYVPVTDYGAAVQALAAGKVDFAWLGGFTHVQARTMTEVVPLVMRDIDREFHSVLIASASSGIEQPEQLEGKRFAFGSKSSTSGHLMPRYFLIEKLGIDPDKDFDGAPVYSNAHDATAKMVESGRVDAGALNMQVWERMLTDNQLDPKKVRLIWKTPPFVDYVWTARAAVDEDLRQAFIRAFLALDVKNPEHRPILDRLGARKYVPARASDFDTVEKVARQVGLIQ